jgi:hypothetical protein
MNEMIHTLLTGLCIFFVVPDYIGAVFPKLISQKDTEIIFGQPAYIYLVLFQTGQDLGGFLFQTGTIKKRAYSIMLLGTLFLCKDWGNRLEFGFADASNCM